MDLWDRFSGVPLSRETAEALAQTTALPQVPGPSQGGSVATDPAGTWGVVFGGDTTLDAAKNEVTQTAKQMGIEHRQVRLLRCRSL